MPAPAPAPSLDESDPEPIPEPEPEPLSETIDEVFARVARWRPELESACAARPKLACVREGDLDGDGRLDRVALVRRRGDEKIGLAILWGRGGGDLLGAGRRGRWRENFDGATSMVPIIKDFAFLARWDLWRADGPPRKRHGFVNRRGERFEFRGVVGDGLLIDGGESATVVFWDGRRWHIEYLGF